MTNEKTQVALGNTAVADSEAPTSTPTVLGDALAVMLGEAATILSAGRPEMHKAIVDTLTGFYRVGFNDGRAAGIEEALAAWRRSLGAPK